MASRFCRDWPGKTAFNKAALTPFKAGGKPAGELWSASNFTFMRVYDAGHMVPRDQPAAALAMVNAFTQGTI